MPYSLSIHCETLSVAEISGGSSGLGPCRWPGVKPSWRLLAFLYFWVTASVTGLREKRRIGTISFPASVVVTSRMQPDGPCASTPAQEEV